MENDYIGRKDAFEAIVGLMMHGCVNGESVDFEDVRKTIENVSAADVAAVRKGHWKERYITRDGTRVCQCSECGNVAVFAAEFVHKYCHDCGAKMDKYGEQDDER